LKKLSLLANDLKAIPREAFWRVAWVIRHEYNVLFAIGEPEWQLREA